jgi:hypothetical protein
VVLAPPVGGDDPSRRPHPTARPFLRFRDGKPYDRAAVSLLVRHWAAGLRRVAEQAFIPSDEPGFRHPWSDVWILLSINPGRPATPFEVIDTMNFNERLVPSFEELSYGLVRLQDAGYLTVSMDEAGEWWVTASDATRELQATAWRQPNGVGSASAYVARALGAPESMTTALYELGDRSLGRLPGLTEADYDRMIDEGYGRGWAEMAEDEPDESDE